MSRTSPLALSIILLFALGCGKSGAGDDGGPGTPCTEASECDDGVDCTVDTCDPVEGCVNTATDSLCDDGLFCNGAETCDAVGDCQAGTPPMVDDAIGCTDDSCDEDNDVVVNAVNDANCDDAVACTDDVCDATLDCQFTANDANCDDGDFCNGAETCDAVSDCQAGVAPVTDDGVPCTDDSCDEVNDVIVNAVNDGNCDDGQWCNGAETCDAVSDCQAGTAPSTDDGVVCTDDSCDEVNDVIVNTANDANCDNGDYCDGSETCDAVSDCQPGTAPSTDDGVACTDDSCDEVNDVIVNTANDANCDNGDFCDGSETCDAVSDCQPGIAPSTDDGVSCTDDSCDEVNDVIVNATNDGNCDDGDFCTGDRCDAVSDCQYSDICDGSFPPNCSGSSGTFAVSPGSAIPDSPGGPLTSTIAVSSAPPNLWSVTVTTDITHTWAADLEITLVSPAGSRVTLSTDNGGGNDDVFSGTVWVDTAGDPATDHSYSNNVTATPLTPEGALTGLRGEDPNGTWTLEIRDDAGADTGTLNSWSLDIEATDDAPTYSSSSVSGSPGSAISDAAPVVEILNVANSNFLCGLAVTTDITHTWSSDLDITITEPGGVSTTLTTDNAGSNDDVFSGTSWDDSVFDPATDYSYTNNVTATPLTPEGALGAFSSIDMKGDWTITVVDDAGGDVGTLNSWGLDLMTCSCAP